MVRLTGFSDIKDLPALLGYLTPDAEFRFANNPSAHGHEAVGAIGGSQHRFIHAWEDTGTAACEGEVTYTRHDGSTLTVPFVNVFYLCGGKIARYPIVIDNSALFT
jgi:SnoaL-like domain